MTVLCLFLWADGLFVWAGGGVGLSGRTRYPPGMSGNRLSAAERRERDAKRSVENNGGSTGGVTGKGFRPGSSGNPGGRPKGLAAMVKDRVEPSELVDILLDAARDPRAKVSERIAAVRELADRGWGKAPAFAAIEGGDPLELSAIAQEIPAIADEVAARRDAREGPVGPSADAASG